MVLRDGDIRRSAAGDGGAAGTLQPARRHASARAYTGGGRGSTSPWKQTPMNIHLHTCMATRNRLLEELANHGPAG